MTNSPASPSSRSTNTRVKPTLHTRYHIDYDWWKREGADLRTYLISHLLPEQRTQFENNQSEELVDFIDPDTAEVRRADALQRALVLASKDSGFITDHTTVVDAIFRVFVANGNRPLSPEELSKQINRPAATILKMLSGTQVYKGLRPVTE